MIVLWNVTYLPLRLNCNRDCAEKRVYLQSVVRDFIDRFEVFNGSTHFASLNVLFLVQVDYQ